METCPNCGNDVRPTARFCTSCGFRMPERASGAGETGSTAGGSSITSGWGVVSTEPEQTIEQPAFQERPSPFAAPAEPGMAATTTTQQPAAASQQAGEQSAVEAAGTGAIEQVESELRRDQVEESESPPVPVPTGLIPDVVAEETINDQAANRVNIALFHIERLRQLVPDITGWSEEQAASVDKAIAALETALSGREEAGDPYQSLRETVKIAKRDPRDIDIMIALTDRAGEIEDLLAAHDAYSTGVRDALFAIKPAAVDYVAAAKKRPARRRTATRKSTSSRSKAAAPKKTDATAKENGGASSTGTQTPQSPPSGNGSAPTSD
jgi:hypothetical protein